MKTESKIVERLACALTPEEFDTKSHDLAGLCQEVAAKKSDAQWKAKRAKEEIEELESRRQDIAQIVRNREEYRDVECVQRFDYVDHLVRTIRLDTGETVKTRAMELHEYQEEMDLHALVMSTAENAVPLRKSAKG